MRVYALRPQERRNPLSVGDGQAIHDPAARHPRDLLSEPGQTLGLVGQRDRIEGQRSSGQRTSKDGRVIAELFRHIVDDAVIRGGRGRENGYAWIQGPEDPTDPTIVRPKVVSPVRDAVGLIDDEQPD